MTQPWARARWRSASARYSSPTLQRTWQTVVIGPPDEIVRRDESRAWGDEGRSQPRCGMPVAVTAPITGMRSTSWQRAATVSATVSPGMSGQNPRVLRAPMLDKSPIPGKLPGARAPRLRLWIRRVLVRAQEGQLKPKPGAALICGVGLFCCLFDCCSAATVLADVIGCR